MSKSLSTQSKQKQNANQKLNEALESNDGNKKKNVLIIKIKKFNSQK